MSTNTINLGSIIMKHPKTKRLFKQGSIYLNTLRRLWPDAHSSWDVLRAIHEIPGAEHLTVNQLAQVAAANKIKRNKNSRNGYKPDVTYPPDGKRLPILKQLWEAGEDRHTILEVINNIDEGPPSTMGYMGMICVTMKYKRPYKAGRYSRLIWIKQMKEHNKDT